MYDSFLGSRIKSLREAAGMTQAELGEKLGISKNQISAIENEKTRTTLDNVVKLADIFSVSVDYLLGRSEERRIAIRAFDDEEVVCLKCGAIGHRSEADYCFNCGSMVKNYCTNDECELNHRDNGFHTYRIALPAHAKYCYACGSKSLFLSEGLLTE